MLVAARNIQVCYGSRIALDGFGFDMAPGETAAILGPNGSGKTTFFRLCLGLLRHSKGRIEIMGGPPGNLHSLSKIGATIESPSLCGHLSALDNLKMTAHLKGKRPTNALAGLIREVGLSDAKSAPVSTYSLGMRQRLALAQALVGEPELLILDEPTIGLDPAGIRWFREWITAASANRSLSVLFSSHILNEVAQIAQKVVLLKNAKVRFAGTLDELKGAGSRKIRIKTTDISHAHAFLQSQGLSAAVENDALILDCPMEQRPEIASLLVRSGHGLLEFAGLEPTLEDRYLSIMEKGE